MDQPLGIFKSVVRIINSNLIRYSNGSYEIFIDLEAQNWFGGVNAIDAYHYATDILQAREILQPLRPGSIHFVEGQLRWSGGEIFTLMGPVYLPYCCDNDLACRFFNKYEGNERIQTLQSETIKTVSGCIGEVLIEDTKDGTAAIILLAEREDFCLIILPDLFETYKGEILGGKYLEYGGMLQNCSVTFSNGDSCTSAIIVKTVEVPE